MAAANVLTRFRNRRPRLYAAARGGLVVVALVVLLNLLLPGIVSAIPFPDLPDFPSLPDLPGWTRWLRLGLVIAVVAIIVIGAVVEDRGPDESECDD